MREAIIVAAMILSVATLLQHRAIAADWQGRDIGAVGVIGSVEIDADQIAVTASGTDIWGASDQFHFVYLPINFTDSATLTARVVSLENTHAWAKAGLMVRDTLDPISRHTMIVITPENGVSLQRRPTQSGISQSSTVSGIVVPRWLRLEIIGDIATVSYSANGMDWVILGSHQLDYGLAGYVGLAVTSHTNTQVTTAVFDHVTLQVDAKPSGGKIRESWSFAWDHDGDPRLDHFQLTWVVSNESRTIRLPASAREARDIVIPSTFMGDGAAHVKACDSDDRCSGPSNTVFLDRTAPESPGAITFER